MADVVMPRLSDSMEEGTILQWLKQVGDEIAVGDELVEIETDKANMAYESDVAGTLTEIVAEEGETLPIGSTIARVGEPAEGPVAARLRVLSRGRSACGRCSGSASRPQPPAATPAARSRDRTRPATQTASGRPRRRR